MVDSVRFERTTYGFGAGSTSFLSFRNHLDFLNISNR